MNRTTNLIVLVILMLRTVAAAQPAPTTDVALAQRLQSLAMRSTDMSQPAPEDIRQCAALLEAARRLDPNDDRIVRSLADAANQLADLPRALDALTHYRRLRPADQTAQLEVIDLYVRQMQTLDAKVKYLADIAARDSVPAEVRSAVAMRCATLLREKGDDVRASEMVDRAIALNPVNVSALAAKYALVESKATAPQRLALCLSMLRANPAQPALMTSVARELAGAGLITDSAKWFERAVFMGTVSAELGLDYCGELLLDGQAPKALKILDQILEADPQGYLPRVMRILALRQADPKATADIDRARIDARNIIINRMAELRRDLGVAGATTQPINQGPLPLPDLSSDTELWKKAQGRLQEQYLHSLAELAWFVIYFERDAAAAAPLVNQYVKLIEQPAPTTAPADAESKAITESRTTTANRLAGWLFFVRQQPAEAKVKLSAVAEKDPMAALGLVLVQAADPNQRPAAQAEGTKLLSKYPVGILGALLSDGLRDLSVKIAPGPDAPAMRAELARFPERLLEILQNPARFYTLRAEPLRISVPYGEPILLRVTVQNISEYDLTIGEDGILRPHLWIDVFGQGLFRRSFEPIVLFERMSEQLVLRPRQSITMTVRLDRGALAAFLSSNPRPAVSLGGVVRTNILSGQEGLIAGPASQAISFARSLERAAFPNDPAMLKRVADSIAQGAGPDKLRSLELLTISAAPLLAQDDAQAKAQGQSLLDVIGRARNDADVAVRAWASLQYALAAPSAEQDSTAQRMLKDEAWQVRLLGATVAAALDSLPLERRKALLAGLANEPDPAVRELATASLELLKRPPATQPTTRPGTRPAAAAQ